MVDLKITLEIGNIDGTTTTLESQSSEKEVECSTCDFKECESTGFSEQCAIFSFEVWAYDKYLSFKEKK